MSLPPLSPRPLIPTIYHLLLSVPTYPPIFPALHAYRDTKYARRYANMQPLMIGHAHTHAHTYTHTVIQSYLSQTAEPFNGHIRHTDEGREGKEGGKGGRAGPGEWGRSVFKLIFLALNFSHHHEVSPHHHFPLQYTHTRRGESDLTTMTPLHFT